jgi:hypothetical protein
LLSRVLDRVRRVWRDKVAGPTLRTYDAACDELGGAPWRQLPEATDRWFLADRPKSLAGTSASAPQPPTLETGSFDLRRRLSDSTRLVLLAVAALIAIVVVMFALTSGSTHVTPAPAAPIVTAPSTVPAAVTPPAVGSPTVKPADAFVAGKRHFAHRRRR